MAARASWITQQRLTRSIVVIIAMTLLEGRRSQSSTHSAIDDDCNTYTVLRVVWHVMAAVVGHDVELSNVKPLSG